MKYYMLVVMCIISSAGLAQYKNDNVKYKTVFLEDFCETLKNSRDFVLLDVRSKGEYADTSSQIPEYWSFKECH